MKTSRMIADEEQQAKEKLNEVLTPDVETIKKWITDDLGRARSLLQAIHDDPNILNLVAVHMHGKIENWKNQQKDN